MATPPSPLTPLLAPALLSTSASMMTEESLTRHVTYHNTSIHTAAVFTGQIPLSLGHAVQALDHLT